MNGTILPPASRFIGSVYAILPGELLLSSAPRPPLRREGCRYRCEMSCQLVMCATATVQEPEGDMEALDARQPRSRLQPCAGSRPRHIRQGPCGVLPKCRLEALHRPRRQQTRRGSPLSWASPQHNVARGQGIAPERGKHGVHGLRPLIFLISCKFGPAVAHGASAGAPR